MTVTVDSRKDLNSLFISIFETFSLHPENVVEMPWPTAYTRQMLSILVKAGLVHTEEADDGVYYQCLHTYDEIDVDEAQHQFDEWFDNHATSIEGNNNMNTTASTRTAKSATLTPCYCGCKGMSKGFYLPGHDARHAGQVGRAIAANYTTKGFDRRELLADLPSEKLVAKAERIAETAIAKIEKKAKPASDVEHGIVKVGKNEFVAERLTNGVVRYLDAKGISKIASASATKTFQVG